MKLALIALVFCFALSSAAQSGEFNSAFAPRRAVSTDRILIEWRNTKPNDARLKASGLLAKANFNLHSRRPISDRMEVLQLDRKLASKDLDAALATIRDDPNVLSASPDLRRHIHAAPADPLYADQWYLQSTQTAASHADQAWDITTGTASTIVAVLDTGVRFEHPDLGRFSQGGKVLDGYDFVTNPSVANDGNGRDADASDPGDWVSANDQARSEFKDCDVADSSWHGTRVSSLIAASTNNGIGMAGSSWSALILPVRVMGKCGGYDSDIITGMRWAAGLVVPGIPLNPTSAKVINLSLGGEGTCTPAYQSAINDVTSAGAVVVVSVGNEGGAVDSPANCIGVIGVAAVRHAGTKVGYSNLGPETALAAPGGNCGTVAGTCQYQILSATNSGQTTPDASTYTDAVTNQNVGTSFSAPLVAGAVALMHAVNAQLTPAQYGQLLRDSSMPFPSNSNSSSTQCHVPVGDEVEDAECICTTETCGAGILNSYQAVLAAERPFAVIEAPSNLDAGVSGVLDATSSVAPNQRSIVGYEWSVLNVVGALPAIANPAQATTTLKVDAASQFTVRLTVTDNSGAQNSADIAMSASAPPTPTVQAPTMASPPKANGGGGGVLGIGWTGLAGLLQLCRRNFRKRAI
jgi:serine protease